MRSDHLKFPNFSKNERGYKHSFRGGRSGRGGVVAGAGGKLQLNSVDMDTTFITIHDLSVESRILYASNSIVDILGYYPEEVVNRSSWEYFHPDEIPFAQGIYGRGIKLDKAAVLNYARLRSKSGRWIGCECVFSIVNDVLVGCVSRYKVGIKSQKRAMDAPIVRQLFSSSPKDPRYHMLSYLSNKFTQPSDPHVREPRAALFLNRFTRTLPIMFASNGLQNVLGISSDQLHNKSFYYCVQQNCLPEAIRCLESAKANDSIAYLRFWYRDPREEEEAGRTRRNRRRSSPDMDLEEHTPIRRNRNRSSPGSNVDTEEDEDDDGGVSLTTHMDVDHSDHSGTRYSSTGYSSSRNRNAQQPHSCGSSTIGSRPSDLFDREPNQASSASTTSYNEEFGLSDSASPGIELEAVVSCTSDGLVVILRQARPFALDTVRQRPVHYRNGIYASPWALKPILPTPARPDEDHNKGDYLPSGAPIYEPMYSGEDRARTQTPSTQLTPPRADDFMQSIREVAVFAWALTGINGCLEQYSHGAPMAGAAPAYLPVWEPHASGFEQPDMIMSG